MVVAELTRLGWTHGSDVPPVIATSMIVDGQALGGIIAIADQTTIEVWDMGEIPLEGGVTLRENDPLVRTAHHPNLDRVVSATVVDLTDTAAADSGQTVIRALSAATSAHLAAISA